MNPSPSTQTPHSSPGRVIFPPPLARSLAGRAVPPITAPPATRRTIGIGIMHYLLCGGYWPQLIPAAFFLNRAK